MTVSGYEQHKEHFLSSKSDVDTAAFTSGNYHFKAHFCPKIWREIVVERDLFSERGDFAKKTSLLDGMILTNDAGEGY